MPLQLFLLVGQSNMAGRGAVTDADRQPYPSVFVLNKENTWASQGEPIHFDKPELVGVGLGFTFAKLVADQAPGATIGLIPCAVGGTPVSRWQPGADLYEAAIARARIALKDGHLAGILWHQGESECGNEAQARAYAQSLLAVASGFRRDLNAPDVPFIAGELGEYLYTRITENEYHPRIVNAQVHQLPALLPRSAVVSAAGLGHNGDQLHFNAEALKELGRRYFMAWQSLIKN